MPLQSAPRPSLTAQVIEQLEGLIGSGEWPVGSRIPPEPELVRELGVGRNTVREAVRALVHAGLLEARQGDGTYVRATSDLNAALQRCVARTSVLEAFEVRGSLERDAARLAALRRDDDDMAAIDRALEERSVARRGGDLTAFVTADVRLHQAVVAATHNALLVELYDHLTETMIVTIGAVERAGVEDGLLSRAHSDLVSAIRRRSPGAAERAVERLLRAAREQYESGAAADPA